MHIEAHHRLRWFLPQLKEMFPEAHYVQLVRNGAHCVSSWYRRKIFQNNSEPDVPIEGFRDMERFEQVCWYWTYWNEEIAQYADRLQRLEDLPNLANVNPSGRKHQPFAGEQAEVFKRVCGRLMRGYGYW